MPPDVPDVNRQLLMRSVMRSLRVTRVGNNAARDLRRMLERAHSDVLAQVEGRLARMAKRGFDTGPVTTKRLQELERYFRDALKETTKETRAWLAGQATDVGADEASFQQFMFDDVLPIKHELTLPSRALIRTLVTTQPFGGKVLSRHLLDWNSATLARMNAEIKTGLLSGETVHKLGQRLRHVMGVNRAQGQAFARTAVNHACSTARMATYQENSDIIRNVRWVATLDTDTCLQCGNLDGRRWRLTEQHINPPAHINCRCALAPETVPWWDLGLKGPQVNQSVRASMRGEVPERMTWPEFIAQSPVSDQREALGAARWNRWQQGKESIGQFTNRVGRTLTIAELRRREGR